MQQLSELDGTFVLQETAATPMHISPVIVYDQSSRREGKVRFKEVLEVFRRNLHKSTIFRRKLAGGAMGFDAPYWIEDPGFDLEFHVRHIALPKPGDWRRPRGSRGDRQLGGGAKPQPMEGLVARLREKSAAARGIFPEGQPPGACCYSRQSAKIKR